MAYGEPKELYSSSTNHCKKNPPLVFPQAYDQQSADLFGLLQRGLYSTASVGRVNHLKFHISQGTKVISTLLPQRPLPKIVSRRESCKQTLPTLKRSSFPSWTAPNTIPVYRAAKSLSQHTTNLSEGAWVWECGYVLGWWRQSAEWWRTPPHTNHSKYKSIL